MTNVERLHEQVQQYGKLYKGKNALIAHLSGENISFRLAVYAKCYDCMGFFADGKQDCKVFTCPLHPFMAFKEGGGRKSKTMKIKSEVRADASEHDSEDNDESDDSDIVSDKRRSRRGL